MSFVVTCRCGQQMTVDTAYVGHQVSCIRCGAMVYVAAPAPPASAPHQAQPQPGPAPYRAPDPRPQPAYQPPSTVGGPSAAPQAPTPAPVPQDTGAAEGLPPPPVVPPVSKPGKRRRTFVADWAKDMAETWAEEHAEEIASDDKPSTVICVVAGIMTIVIGAYNTLVFGLLLSGALLAGLGDLKKWTEGGLFIVYLTIMSVLGVWTLIAGATCIAARRGGASAAVPLNLAWAFLAMFTMFQVKFSTVELGFWGSFTGVVMFCCLGTVLTLFARRQAGRYQLWVVRKQQEADGTLVS